MRKMHDVLWVYSLRTYSTNGRVRSYCRSESETMIQCSVHDHYYNAGNKQQQKQR